MVLLGSGSGRAAFLLGETNLEGFALYFPIAFLVKTPIMTLLGLAVAIPVLLSNRQLRAQALFLLIPAVAFFGIMLTNSLNIGYRHLMPLLPLIYVLISGLAGKLSPFSDELMASAPKFLARIAPFVVLSAVFVTTLAIHPHYLSYFNAFAGGPENGHNVLIDSNIDWGQDLFRLQDWMAENEVTSVKLGWFGSARPEYYGIAYEPLPGLPYNLHLFWDPPFDPAAPPPGIYALSASILWEAPLQEKGVFAWFREREPDDRIGYSIFIYEVPAP